MHRWFKSIVVSALCLSALILARTPAHAIAIRPVCLTVESGLVAGVLSGSTQPSPRPVSERGGGCLPGEVLARISLTEYFSSERRGTRGVDAGVVNAGYWINSAVALFLFFATAYWLGRRVLMDDWNPNLTRKVLGAVMLIAPFLIAFGVPYTANHIQVVGGYLLFLGALLLFCRPLRSRSKIVETAFAAIDRPEDRPYTLVWLVSSYAATAILTLAMAWWLLADHRALAFVVIVSVVLGDLLAGAIGYRYGAHSYETTALFTSRTYTRSLEGSACVFLTTAVLVLLFLNQLPFAHFIAVLAL